MLVSNTDVPPFIVKPENTWTLYKTQNPTSLARFPNLATLESVNLSVGFTIIVFSGQFDSFRISDKKCLWWAKRLHLPHALN